MNLMAFQKLDRTIHEKGRMAIMALLAATPQLTFTEIRDTLRMTDGNLSVHLRTLQEAGYLAVTKTFHNRRPLTTCALTASGRKEFANYIHWLGTIVAESKRA